MCNNMTIQFITAMNQLRQMQLMTEELGLPNSIMPAYGARLPYYNFSNTSRDGAGGANTVGNNSLASTQNMMNQLGFTSANGYSVAQNTDGSLLFTYNKDGKTCIASTLRELIDNVNSNATDNSSKLEDSLAVHKDDKDEVAEENSETPDGTTPDAADETDPDAPATPTRHGHTHMPNLSGKKIGGKELEWKGYNKIDSNTRVGKYIKDNVKNGTTLDRLVKVMLPRATKEEREMYKQWLIDANPNGIVDGKVADVNKLDLPVYKTASAATGTTAYSRVVNTRTKIAKQTTNKDAALEEEQQFIKYNGTNNKIYNKNGLGVWDDDAIFVINGQNYTIEDSIDPNKKKLDYREITGQREVGSDFKLVDPSTGHFNPDKGVFTGSTIRTNPYGGSYSEDVDRHFILKGSGTLTGAMIKLENGRVVLKNKNNETIGLMDDVMLGKI